MKFSNQSLEKLLGNHQRARHKINNRLSMQKYFEEPIIHREIQGDKVYVPLNLARAWNI